MWIPTDWFYEPVKSAWQNDLIDGVTARYFKPERSLTVAQDREAGRGAAPEAERRLCDAAKWRDALV